MNEDERDCRYAEIYGLQFASVREDLGEVKERVRQLETLLTRGVMLLVANLLGVAFTLARQLMAQ
jgi:hypothetical protein